MVSNCAESDLSKDQKNKVSDADDGTDENLRVAGDAKEAHKEPIEEGVLRSNDPFPVLPCKQKFGSLTDTLDESKYVDLPPQRPKTYTTPMPRRQWPSNGRQWRRMILWQRTVHQQQTSGNTNLDLVELLVGYVSLSMSSSHTSQMKCLKTS